VTAAAAVLRGHAGFMATASPLYRDLMLRLADDIDAGGPAAAVVDGEAPADWQDAFALRLMAAVHRAVLERRAPALALHYPSVGGDGRADLAWPSLRALMVEQPEQLRRDLARPCQTNDPGPGLVAHVAMEPAIPPDPDGMAVTVSFAGEAPVRVATAGPHGPPVRLAVGTAVRMA